jgi:hypothetical protein
MQDMINFFKRYQFEFDQQNWLNFAALFYEPAMSVRADGYVMLIVVAGSLAIKETLYKSLPFNVTKDFDGVSMVASSPIVLVANTAFAARGSAFLTLAVSVVNV